MTMPLMGFGTWIDLYTGQDPRIMGTAVETALQVGYRHFDTALNYGTQPFVINSILKSGISRNEIFLTSKGIGIPSIEYLESNLHGMGYYDIFLLHHPPHVRSIESFRAVITKEWLNMNNLYNSGLVKHIGVSNFYPKQLEILLQVCNSYNLKRPEINQIELHPVNQNWDLVNLCNQNDIQVVAHSPLGGGASQLILQSEVIQNIANEIGATPAQVVLASTMRRGIGVIPRSLNGERMIENFQSINYISMITEEHLERLKQLDIGMPLTESSMSDLENNNQL